jgi:hypothetical protein
VDVVDVVPTVNVALVAPAGTVTFDGSVAGLAPDNCTTAPLAGAGPLSVTVPVEDEPAATVDGLSVSDVTPTVTPGLTVTPALAVDAPNAAGNGRRCRRRHRQGAEREKLRTSCPKTPARLPAP